jgi:hypothetical protein
MKEQMVLLRAVHGTWEGWQYMALDEFLHRLDLKGLKAGQLLVGMVLPPARQQMPNCSTPESHSDPSHYGEPTPIYLQRGWPPCLCWRRIVSSREIQRARSVARTLVPPRLPLKRRTVERVWMFEHEGFRPLWPVIFFLPWLLVGVGYLLESVLHWRSRTASSHPVYVFHSRLTSNANKYRDQRGR